MAGNYFSGNTILAEKTILAGKQFWQETILAEKQFWQKNNFGKKTILAGKLFWQENYFSWKINLMLFSLSDLIISPYEGIHNVIKVRKLAEFSQKSNMFLKFTKHIIKLNIFFKNLLEFSNNLGKKLRMTPLCLIVILTKISD